MRKEAEQLTEEKYSPVVKAAEEAFRKVGGKFDDGTLTIDEFELIKEQIKSFRDGLSKESKKAKFAKLKV